MQNAINLYFNDDYFNNLLPKDLNNSSANSPAWFGYVAALNILGTNILFSSSPLAKYFLAGSSGKKNAIDKHHIFPKNYLTSIGFDQDRDRNQIANFTFLDYATNIDISDKPPAVYGARYREKLGEEKYLEHLKSHSIPENFDTLDYLEFLNQRRTLMALKIKEAYQSL